MEKEKEKEHQEDCECSECIIARAELEAFKMDRDYNL